MSGEATRFDRFCLLCAGVVPAAMTAWWGPDVAAASRDANTISALGFAFTGLGHLLDPLRGAIAKFLPLGTQVYRLALINALIVGAFAVLFAAATKRALAALDQRASRLSAGVAMFAALAVTLSPAWQSESASGGGAVLAVGLAISPGFLDPKRSPGAILLSLTLALLAEPLTGLVGVAITLGSRPHREAFPSLRVLLTTCALAVLFVVLATLGSRTHTNVAPDAVYKLVAGRDYVAKVKAIVDTEWGAGSLLIATSGLIIGYLQGEKALVRSSGMTAAGALLLLAFSAPSAQLMLSCVVVTGFAVLAHVILLRVRYANLAFARASSGLIFVMLLAWPFALADMTNLRMTQGRESAEAQWDQAVLGSLPKGALFVTDHDGFIRRLTALRVARGIGVETTLLDPSSMKSPMSRAAARTHPQLALWRDLYFEPKMGEFSLARDSAVQPTFVTRTKRFERPILRHLVPDGLVFHVEVEPRAQSDRRRALEASRPLRQLLVNAAQDASDAALTDLTTSLLRAQVIATASGGDRDLVPAIIEDLLRVYPDQAFVEQVRRRLDSPTIDDLE